MFFPQIDPHFPVVSCFFCSVIPWRRGQPARFGLEAASEPISLWNKSRRCPLIGSLSAPSVQKQKVSICFCFQCQCRVTASKSSRGASWQQVWEAEEDSVCLLPGVHLSHEVVWIVAVLQTTCRARIKLFSVTGGTLSWMSLILKIIQTLTEKL